VIQTRRILAGAAAAVVCVLVASACDTSPVAASANGEKIKQTALNAELRAVSSNKAYVAYYDGEQSNQSQGVQIVGDAPGTYGANYVAQTLTGDIQAAIERQYLAAHHRLPGPGLVAALRGFEADVNSTRWPDFPPAYRNELATKLAYLAEFVTTSPDTKDLRATATDASTYLYSRVCVRSIGVAEDNANGSVDYASARSKAVAIVQQNALDNELGSVEGAAQVAGGVVTCYTPAQLEDRGNVFYQRILHLGVHRITAPIKTSFGYQLYVVTSRTHLPFDASLARAATLILDLSQQSAFNPVELRRVLASARVHVDPQYGTWDPSKIAVVAPDTLGANGTQSVAGS
jgi:hypothetical protein